MRTITKTSLYLFSIALLAVGVLGISSQKIYAADSISSASYIDSDDDGTVDHLKWTFDTNITQCTYEANDWVVVTPGDINVAVTGIDTSDPESSGEGDCNGSDAVVYLTVTADSGETGGSTDPVVSYLNQGAAGSLQDSGVISSKASITQSDGAAPVLTAVTTGTGGNLNRLTFTYTEPMTVLNGGSTASKGDITTAGTVAGFGSFATTGDVQVNTGLNTIGGNGTDTITIDLAGQAGGYLQSASSTQPSGVFTPVGSAQLTDANALQVNTLASGPTTSGTAWDLTKPTLSSVTIDDAAGDNGQVDQALIIFSEAVRDSNITNGDADLGSGGTTTGTFSTDGADDNTTTFNRTVDDNGVDTSASAGDFTYSGATTLITDIAGNLLDTATDGQIATGDIVEIDGADPILTGVTLSLSGNRNRISFAYSENITLSGGDGASTTLKGDIASAGTVAGFGTFASAGDVAAVSTKNTISGSGTSTITLDLADQTGGYLQPTSSSEPSGVFTPVASAQVADANSNQVNTSVTPTAAGGGWDLTKPNLSSITVNDAAGSNGRIDQAVLVFDSPMRDSSFVDARADLGSTGTTTGTFSTGTPNDATMTFNRTADDNALDTSVAAGDFTYTGSGEYITDLAGNLVDTTSDGDIATSDMVETDGAAPVVLSAEYSDTNTDGAVDRVRFNTSTDVGIVCTAFTAQADFTVGTPGDVNLVTNAGDSCVTDGSTYFAIDLATPGAADTTGGTTAPVVTYAQPGNGVEDGAGNDVPTAAGVTVADYAAPIYVDSITIDNDGDGTVDYVRVEYSEAIDDSSVAAGDYEAGIADTTSTHLAEAFTSGQPAAGTYTDVVDDEYIYVAVSDGTTETITALKTDYQLYIEQAGAVNDNSSAGNTLVSFIATQSSDGASPIILIGSAYTDSDGDGTVDEISMDFSENINFTFAPADWAFGVAGAISLAGDYLPGDCIAASANVTCTDANNSDVTADANETGANGGAEPRWDYNAGTPGNINDGNGNNLAAVNTTLADAAAPIPVSATLDYNDNVSELVVTFSEEVDSALTDESDFSISNAPGGGEIPLTQATTTVGDSLTQTFSLTEIERNSAYLLSGMTGGDAVAVVLDTAATAVTESAAGGLQNVLTNGVAVAETEDTNAPTLTQWDIDFNNDQFTLTFSETVDVSSVDWTTVTIQDGDGTVVPVTTSYTLTGGSTASSDGITVVLDLNATDVNAIKADTGLATSSADAYMSITAGFIDDMGTNDITAIANTAGLQAASYSGSGSIGSLTAPHVLLASNILGQVTVAGIQFQNENDLPADGKIVIIFPTGFYTGAAAAITNANNIDGTFAVTYAGDTVTITRQNDGTIVSGGTSIDFDLESVTNPIVEGTTGTFTFETRTAANALIDQNIAVSGTPIIMAPSGGNTNTGGGGGGGGGGGSSPTIKVAGLVKEEEAKAAAKAAEEAVAAEEATMHKAAGPVPEFMDTFGHWAEGYVRRIAQMGIVEGKGENQFAPNDNITRAELLKIALGSFEYEVPEEVTQNPLPDVMIGDWYAPYVKSAFDNDIIYGFNNGFGPNSPATRGMAATILVKSAEYDDVDTHFAENYTIHPEWTYANFPDVPMDAYYAPFVSYLADMQIVSGYEDGTFGPDNSITRGEIAKIVVNILGLDPIEVEEPIEEEVTAEEEVVEPVIEDEEMMEGQGLDEEEAEEEGEGEEEGEAEEEGEGDAI